MTRALTAALVALALLLTGCSGGAQNPVPPEQSVVASQPAGPDEVPDDLPDVDPDQQFSLDDTALFDDGLEIEIAGSFASKAEKGDVGAESTGGEIVTASVRVENNTPGSYDPRNTTITATYDDGDDDGADTVAPTVTNEGNELTGTFDEVIAVADEGVTAAGFAIPTDGLARVTFVIDLHDDSHDPLSFTGRVARS